MDVQGQHVEGCPVPVEGEEESTDVHVVGHGCPAREGQGGDREVVQGEEESADHVAHEHEYEEESEAEEEVGQRSFRGGEEVVVDEDEMHRKNNTQNSMAMQYQDPNYQQRIFTNIQ